MAEELLCKGCGTRCLRGGVGRGGYVVMLYSCRGRFGVAQPVSIRGSRKRYLFMPVAGSGEAGSEFMVAKAFIKGN